MYKEEYAAYRDYRKDICNAMEISCSTVDKYIRLLKEKKDCDMRPVDFIHYSGHPRRSERSSF